MMGDPGTSDTTLLHYSLENRQRDEFQGRAPPSFTPDPRLPSSSNDLYRELPPYFQPSDHHVSVPFRQDAYEEGSQRASLPSSGPGMRHGNWVGDRIQGRSCHSDDTLESMAGARVGEDDLLIYPRGEDDAVTITRKDLEGLGPGKFLSDNIIDFYIKYLNLSMLSQENRNRLHFFNSFVFRKLLESSSSTGIGECKVDYEKFRKWSGGVNIFEKDYVFMPIIESSHWSLIVICLLRSLLPSSHDEKKSSPFILHLDPIEGTHKHFEGHIRSFVFQSWMDRIGAVNDIGLLHSLAQMKYVQAKVLQQDNSYDCGLYVLHYIEVFLSKPTSWDLTFVSSEGGAHFTRSSFQPEVWDKRNRIRSLIIKLGGISQVHDDGGDFCIGRNVDQGGLVQCPKLDQKGLRKVVKERKSKKWSELETSILLQCMVEGGQFCKGKKGVMDWDLISQEINKRNGESSRSKEQCQNRFDTLLKAYKDLRAFCMKSGKKFMEVTDDEKRGLKLATPLPKEHEGWYNDLNTIDNRRSSFGDKFGKRQKLNLNGDIGTDNVASCERNLMPRSQTPPNVIRSLEPKKASLKQDAIRKFKFLDDKSRCTFLNLIQVCSHFNTILWDCDLEIVCRVVACIQDQNPFEIRKYVYELLERKLLRIIYVGEDYGFNPHVWTDGHAQISGLEKYKKLGKKVLCKNVHLNIFWRISSQDSVASELFPLHQVKMLILYECEEIEEVDLGDFPDLRYLEIGRCAKLKVVRGWEVVQELGWIDISQCESYDDFPKVQCLSLLKEFRFRYCGESIDWQLAKFSQCYLLRRLEIWNGDNLWRSMDVKGLKYLEVLSLRSDSLSNVEGMSGQHVLCRLDLSHCTFLRKVPNLSCLKALTQLDMSHTGIVEIPEIEELHLLTLLDFSWCKYLKKLPFLGHLNVLASLNICFSNIEGILRVEGLVSLEELNISHTGVEKVPGVGGLMQLKELNCRNSELKWLPYMHHLPRLHTVSLQGTPFEEMDPSWRDRLCSSFADHWEVNVDDISDISDISVSSEYDTWDDYEN